MFGTGLNLTAKIQPLTQYKIEEVPKDELVLSYTLDREIHFFLLGINQLSQARS